MTLDEIRTLAEAAITPFLAKDGFLNADVVEQPDQMGDDSLYFRLHFAPGSKVARGIDYMEARAAVFDALHARGEKRFPYLRLDYPDDPPRSTRRKCMARSDGKAIEPARV